MNEVVRFKLRFGNYKAPVFRYGAEVNCEVCGQVRIVGISDGPIPWPVHQNAGRRSLVVYQRLSQAVRKESNQAVAHWWGVNGQTVTKWRKALGVGRETPGSQAIRVERSKEPWFAEMQRKAWSKARDPERCEKIAVSKRGKPRPASVIRALRKANLGRKASEETKRKMSIAAKARGAYPPAAGVPWTAKEDRLIRAGLPTAEIVQRTGRTISAVQSRRRVLKRAQM